MNLDLFRKKRVLVTGDTGFKGSWLSLWLKLLGAEVTGLALPAEKESHFNLLKLGELVDHRDCDLRNLESVRSVVEDSQPEIVFHLGAQALVKRSYDDPVETFATNFMGGINLLEVLRSQASAKAIVFITSDKAYLNKEWSFGYRETDELGGKDPYSASKAAAEIAVNSYRHSFLQCGLATTRAGNVIGGGDFSADRIVPDCFRSHQNETDIVLRNPAATRPWQHVLDPLAGYLTLATALLKEPEKYSGGWNFGPLTNAEIPVRALAEALVKQWGRGKVRVEAEPGAVHEANLLALSIDKARHKLGWSPRWNFDQTISKTAEWYQKYAQAETMLEVSKAQISEYMEQVHD